MAVGAGSLDKHVGVAGLDVCGVHVVHCGSACACQRAMVMPLYQPISAPEAAAAAPHPLPASPGSWC